jgi:hypothetical protein
MALGLLKFVTLLGNLRVEIVVLSQAPQTDHVLLGSDVGREHFALVPIHLDQENAGDLEEASDNVECEVNEHSTHNEEVTEEKQI